jgi:peptidoglycan/LPS O-acetylase OafA/YrhL
MEEDPRPNPRVKELDAVRGLAAIAVVFRHLAITLPAVADATRSHGLTPLNILLFSPLAAVLDGTAAVVIFFVLSGYVLALSYEGGRQTYPGFIARRIARLWVPYIVAVTIAMILATIVGDTLVSPASHWFNARWQGSVSIGVILQHLSLVGHYRDFHQYVPVIWSLTDEMRISVVFPLLLAAVALFRWRLSIAATVILTVVGVELSYKISSDLATLEYVVCFVAGAVLAKHQASISRLIVRITTLQRRALLVLALLLYTWEVWMPPSLLPHPLSKLASSQATYVLLETGAAAIFIVLARYPGRARRFLLSAVPQYFGRVSYSLYLLHTIVLLTIIHIVNPSNVGSILALYPAIFLISVALADLSQRWIEFPAQRLGRRLATRFEHGVWRQDEAPSRVAVSPTES